MTYRASMAAGQALEESLDDGMPRDELFVYEDALRKGRTVVITLVEDDRQADAARKALTQAGAESIDAARESWWIRLRDVEKKDYKAHGGDFETDELIYRRGIEAALRLGTRGKSYIDVIEFLVAHYPGV